MENSAEANPAKCYSGVLRRLLCGGSLPTHPSDQFIESNVKEIGDQKPENSLQPKANVKQVAASTPGVVARLMGLDSFPDASLPPKHTTLGSFFRSRSVNSIDFLSHFDPTKQGHHQHRRVRTSVSFREGINDDYTSVVLHLEEVEKATEYQQELLIRTRPNVNCQQDKKERGARSKNSGYLQEKKVSTWPSKELKMEEKRRSVCVKLSSGVTNASQKRDFQGKTKPSSKERRSNIRPVNSKEELVGSKCRNKKKKRMLAHKVNSGCSLKKVHPEGTVPELAGGVHPRKPLPSQFANSQNPYSSGAHSDNGEVRAIIKGKAERKMKNDESCYNKRMVEKICALAEEDIKENWVHLVVVKSEDFEEICQQFGQEILEVLLKQFVDELVLL